jgi:hypothetical protein
MAEESKAIPAPPPRGMIEIDGVWQIRRAGLIAQRKLTCIFGHRVILGLRPFEVAAPCGSRDGRASQIACDAHLYILTMRARLLWAMDMTIAESEIIASSNMEPAEIVIYFGVGFPIDMKITKLTS